MGRAFNERGSKVVINGHEATRTRRAGSPAAKRKAREMQQAELRDTVLKMYLERVSQVDIGAALNLSQGRISQILKEAWEARQPDRAQTIEHARERALMENDLHLSPWIKRARTSPRAAEVLLSYLSRADRIQGLYQQHSTLTLGNLRPPDDPSVDLSRLSYDELCQWESLHLKAQGVEPEPECEPPPPAPTIGPYTQARLAPSPPLEQQPIDDTIVAVVDREDTTREKILRLHREGMKPTAIMETLSLSHAQFLEALENPDSRVDATGGAV